MKYAFLFVSMLVVSCGGPGSSSENLSYDFTSNGCHTGSQSFSSKEAYCAGLRNRSLNKGCAYSMRKEAYLRDCGSEFTETN